MELFGGGVGLRLGLVGWVEVGQRLGRDATERISGGGWNWLCCSPRINNWIVATRQLVATSYQIAGSW